MRVPNVNIYRQVWRLFLLHRNYWQQTLAGGLALPRFQSGARGKRATRSERPVSWRAISLAVATHGE